MERKDIKDLREEYKTSVLLEEDVKTDPFIQFDSWFNQARAADIYEPNAMALATTTPDGRPSCRIVLLKGYNAEGFSFYTNYLSRKGKEMAKNPLAAITFWWGPLERQIRIEGSIEKLSKQQSEEYFHSRPKASQLGAVVSAQSQEINGRADLERHMANLQDRYAESEVPKPSHWGGYILKPTSFEFWQGRRSRLHDRIVFKKADKKTWKIVRLAP